MIKKVLKIVAVTYLHGYVLKITFKDGEVRDIDFYDFLNSSTNTEIRTYLDLNKFKSFKNKDGELMWGDFDLLFPIQDLYDGKISA
jgi:hypothetical protein